MSLHRLAVAVVLTALSLPGVARAEERRFRLGVLGGAARSDLSTHDEDDPFDLSGSALYRPDFGLSAEARLSGPFSIELRGLWTEKGTRLDFEDADSNIQAQIQIGYVAVPLLLKLTKPTGSFRPYAIAGPEIAFRRNARFTASDDGRAVDESIEQAIHDTDFSARLGAGFEMPRGRTSIFLEGSFALGLRNIYRDSERESDPEDADESIKTRAFSIHAGIRF